MNKVSSQLILLYVILFASVSSFALDVKTLGPKEGETIPHDLHSVDHLNRISSLKSLTGKEGVILLFVRSTDWCPFCQKQLIDWNHSLEQFKDVGYNVVAVSRETPELINQFVQKHKINFPILADKKGEIINAFGIRNNSMAKTSDYYGIPHPYIYVFTPKGVLMHRFAETGYRQRPSIESVYSAVIRK